MKKIFAIVIFLGLLATSVILWQVWKAQRKTQPAAPPAKTFPLLQYSIPNLRRRTYSASQLHIEKELDDFPQYTSYLFDFQTLGKKMTGQLNIPKASLGQPFPVILFIRGYVPVESYKTGVGTKSAAAVFAEHGYVTLAPDFFGFGESDPESTDTWEARFQKPMNVAELIKTLEAQPTIASDSGNIQLDSQHLGIWAHSNGGQIALTTLEILDRPIPTTLWAPVTAPFPYSTLYFSDEDEDEGKAARSFVASFEKDYDATQFSLTNFLSDIHGPLQIQQGDTDEAIHYVWSQEFVDKLKKVNPDLPVTLFTYPGTNHNMQPSWNVAITHDLDFFANSFK